MRTKNFLVIFTLSPAVRFSLVKSLKQAVSNNKLLTLIVKQVLKYPKQISVFVVLGVSFLTASPLFGPHLPLSTDSLNHLYILTQLDHLVEQGVFYTRWFPYRASGFGLPLFQYYPPLAFYVAEGFNLLGLETLSTLRLSLGLTLIGGALAMYLWVKDLLGAESAMVAAVAYVCGPYMLFNAYVRGGFSEQFALMLMPLVLWAFYRLASTGQVRYLAISAVCYGATITAHNLTVFIFTPTLVVYIIILIRGCLKHTVNHRVYRNRMIMLGTAIGLGLGLSAFYWLPALVERNEIADLLHTTPELDYHGNFIPLSALFSTLFTPTARPALNIFTIGLAIVGLFGLEWGAPWAKKLKSYPMRITPEAEKLSDSQSRRLHSLYALIMAGGCFVMVLPLSVWIWDAFPLLRFLQFPHRFLGVAMVFVALLAGMGAYSLKQQFKDVRIGRKNKFEKIISPIFMGQPTIIILTIIIGLLLSQTWVLTRVRYYPPLPEIDVNFIMQKEREAGQIGNLYIVNFLPATVKTLPTFAQLARDNPERLDIAALPDEVALISANYHPLRYELTLTSPHPFKAQFNTFFFPGWMAQVDGQAVSITPTEPHGLISVNMPAGEHNLVVRFGSTPIRTMANALTIFSLILLCVGVGATGLNNLKKENFS